MSTDTLFSQLSGVKRTGVTRMSALCRKWSYINFFLEKFFSPKLKSRYEYVVPLTQVEG